MFKWFLPRKNPFRTLFEEDAINLRKAAELFGTLVRDTDMETRRSKALELKELERRGDGFTRRIFETLNATFLTPLDREDIRDLASGIDNVLDDLEAAGTALIQFKISDAPRELIQMSDIMLSSSHEIELLSSLIWEPANVEEVQHRLITVSDLENQADAVYNLVITRLFDPSEGLDALEVMKWKEIYDGIEQGIDRCKEVANVIGNISAKNA